MNRVPPIGATNRVPPRYPIGRFMVPTTIGRFMVVYLMVYGGGTLLVPLIGYLLLVANISKTGAIYVANNNLHLGLLFTFHM